MRIGITGHQERLDADWTWVSNTLLAFLLQYSDLEGWSSLARGADQLFAKAILQLNGKLVAVIPVENYQSHFPDDLSREEFFRLLNHSASVVRVKKVSDPKQAFYLAGRKIVDASETMIAVWDELPSHGLGGTADVVQYAQELRRPILVLNPIKRSSKWQ